jgi:hypothetical protein
MLLFALPALADEAASADPAAPAPPPPEAPVIRFVPCGAMKEMPEKHVLAVTLDSDLPPDAIIQVYLKREQYSTTGEPASRLVDSKRYTVGANPAVPFEMDLARRLPPAVYDVEVVYDSQRQYPAVLKKLEGVKDLRQSFQVSVGSPEEIALEHEWGEGRVVGTLIRLDGILGKLQTPPSPEAWGAFWEEQGLRLGWLADRLGKVGESSPLPDIWFPRTEELLKQACTRLRDAGSGDPQALAQGLQEVSDLETQAERMYVNEFTGHTLQGLHHWLVFVHQEYWLNRIHRRLQPAQWEAFKADQRKRLDQTERNYTAYAQAADPVRPRLARLFPPLVAQSAALLRRLQDSYDADLKEELWKPGPSSEQISHDFAASYRKVGLQTRPLGRPRPD